MSLAIMDCLSTCIFTLTPLLITYPFDFMWMFDNTRRKSPRQVAPISLPLSMKENIHPVRQRCHLEWESSTMSLSNPPLTLDDDAFLPFLFFLILVRVSSQLLLSTNCDTLSLSSRPLIFPIMNHASRSREILWTPQLVETMVTGDTQLLVTNTFITKRTRERREHFIHVDTFATLPSVSFGEKSFRCLSNGSSSSFCCLCQSNTHHLILFPDYPVMNLQPEMTSLWWCMFSLSESKNELVPVREVKRGCELVAKRGVRPSSLFSLISKVLFYWTSCSNLHSLLFPNSSFPLK